MDQDRLLAGYRIERWEGQPSYYYNLFYLHKYLSDPGHPTPLVKLQKKTKTSLCSSDVQLGDHDMKLKVSTIITLAVFGLAGVGNVASALVRGVDKIGFSKRQDQWIGGAALHASGCPADLQDCGTDTAQSWCCPNGSVCKGDYCCPNGLFIVSLIRWKSCLIFFLTSGRQLLRHYCKDVSLLRRPVVDSVLIRLLWNFVLLLSIWRAMLSRRRLGAGVWAFQLAGAKFPETFHGESLIYAHRFLCCGVFR